MDSRKNIFSVFRRQKINRIPWIPLCHRDFFLSLPEYKKKFPLIWIENNYLQEDLQYEELKFRVDFYKKIGADFMDWGIPGFIKIEMNNVEVKRESKGNNLFVKYNTPLGSLGECFTFSIKSQTFFRRDFLIKREEDYKVFKYIIENSIIKPDSVKAKTFLEIVGDNGVIFATGVQSPLHSWVNGLLGIEKLTFELLDQREELIELLKIQDNKNLEKCDIIASLPIKVFNSQSIWDIAIISPNLYLKYYLPYLKKYNQVLHINEKISIDHLSGLKIKPYLELIEDTNIDGLYGFVYPSLPGDIPLRQLLKRWKRKKIIPMGGLDPNLLATSSKQKIIEITKRLLNEIGDKHFILGTADDVVYGTNVDNLEIVSKVIRDFYK